MHLVLLLELLKTAVVALIYNPAPLVLTALSLMESTVPTASSKVLMLAKLVSPIPVE
jgi:hypothetical protein